MHGWELLSFRRRRPDRLPRGLLLPGGLCGNLELRGGQLLAGVGWVVHQLPGWPVPGQLALLELQDVPSRLLLPHRRDDVHGVPCRLLLSRWRGGLLWVHLGQIFDRK